MSGFKKVQDTATDRLNKMINNGRSARAFIAKHVREAYKDAQRQRFITENSSQGDVWQPLNPKYAKYKLTKFADFAGGGRKINIATGRMFNALILKNTEDFSEVIEDRSWAILFKVPYMVYVNEARPIIKFNKEFYQNIKKKLTLWLSGKKI